MEGTVATVVELLYTTYTASDTSVRRQAEERLQVLAASPDTFASTLLHILSSPLPPCTPDLQKSAAHFLKRTLASGCSQGAYSTDQRVQLSRDILGLMVKGSLSSSVLANLTLCLDPLLDHSKHDPEGRVWTTVQSLLVSELASAGVLGALKALKAVFSRSTKLKQAVEFYERINPSLVALTGQITAEGAFGPALDWAAAVNAIIQYFEITQSAYLRSIAADFMLADGCVRVILMKPAGVVQGGLLASEDNSEAAAFNGVKTELLASFRVLIQYLADNKKQMNEENGNFSKLISVVGISVAPSPFINASLQTCPEILISALQICSLEALPAALSLPSLVKALTQALLFLHDCVPEVPFYPTFASTYKAVVAGVALPLLQFTPVEVELMQSDPDEFHALTMDICEGQDRENMKTAAAQLLEALADNIDGALSFSIFYLGQLVEFTALGSASLEQFAALVEMREVSRLLGSSEESRVEVALLGMCVLGYALGKREDLKSVVHNLLESHFDSLSRVQSEMVQARLCHVVQFLFSICISSPGLLDCTLNYLLRCLNGSKAPRAVHIAACSALVHVITEEQGETEEYIPAILGTMISVLPYQTNKDFFEALQKIVCLNVSQVLTRLHQLIGGLVHKIKAELPACQAKASSFIISKCWNVVRTTLDSVHLTIAHLRTCEQLLTPLFEYISAPDAIDFEDDIVLACTSLVKRQEGVSPLCWKVYEKLPAVQRKCRGELRYIFGLLNAIIAYSCRELIGKSDYVQQLIGMCEGALFAQSDRSEVGCTQGAVLLQQLLLMSADGALDLPSLRQIVEMVRRRYGQGCRQPFLRVRLLGTICAAVNYNSDETIQHLGPAELTDFLREVVSQQDSFHHSYDKKLAVVCIVRLLCLNPQPTEIAAASTALLAAAIVIIKAKPPPSSESNPANDLLDDLLADSEDEDLPLEPSSTRYRTEEAEASLLVNSMLTPIHDFDEIGALRSALACVCQRNQGSAQALVGALPGEMRKELGDILQSKRIRVAVSGADPSVLRKIVKAKRHL